MAIPSVKLEVDLSQNKVSLDELSELKHFKDSNTGIWAIDRDPKMVSHEWIKENCFQVGLCKPIIKGSDLNLEIQTRTRG